ncbi:hypothetical protein AVL50_09270 [Flammeovirga sp. SJP92]|nr:hypothetical protein AVL50_09270 [Flammeovirga sp. SJP92]
MSVFTLVGYGQTNKIGTEGNVGIGTLSTSGAKLTILSNVGETENLLKMKVSDAIDDYFLITNYTGAASQFIPLIKGARSSDNRVALGIMGMANPNLDTDDNALISFNARLSHTSGAGQRVVNRPLFSWENYTDKVMVLNAQGRLGIGTTRPTAKLHVQESDGSQAKIRVHGKGENNSGTQNDIYIHGDFVSGTADAASFDRYNVGISSWYGIGFHSSFNNRAGIVFDTRTANAYFDGKVGIGTDTPDSKLTVKGKIHAQEVKVTVSAGETPDYVFKEDYNMMSLEEVERYIKKHSHLPEVKSASQIEEEGLHLAEMNLLLLKKVEELTIHTINQEKEISNLYETVELLINKVNQLEKK